MKAERIETRQKDFILIPWRLQNSCNEFLIFQVFFETSIIILADWFIFLLTKYKQFVMMR